MSDLPANFIPFSQWPKGDHTRYALSSDDWVGQADSLMIAADDRLSERDRAHLARWGGCYVVGRDDAGLISGIIYCDTRESAEDAIASVPQSRCEECGQPLGTGALVVLPAASDLEWNFHYACCDDPDPAARKLDSDRLIVRED